MIDTWLHAIDNGQMIGVVFVDFKKAFDLVDHQILLSKIVSEYDQEIPQSQTADNPVAPRGRAAQPSRDTRKTNLAKQPALSSPSR